MVGTRRTVSLKLPVAALTVVLVTFQAGVEAQTLDGGWSVWAGAATDQFEEKLPASPQLGVRYEVAPASQLLLGVEATSRFVQEEVDCALGRAGTCGPRLSVMPALAVQFRLFLDPGPVLPYFLGTAGRAFSTRGLESRGLLGGGVGMLIPSASSGVDISLEGRYRTDLGYELADHGHWEFLVGISL